MQRLSESEQKLVDIFVEISTANKAGNLKRLGSYADRAVDIMRAGIIEERRKLTTEFASAINREVLTENDRNSLCNAIAESDISDGMLSNANIDALVDLFEAWLERRAALTHRD